MADLFGNVPRDKDGVVLPHLGVYTDAGFHLMTPLPVGAMMGIVEGTEKGVDPMHKMVLVKASHTEIAFRCICSPNCHVVFRFKLEKVTRRHG